MRFKVLLVLLVIAFTSASNVRADIIVSDPGDGPIELPPYQPLPSVTLVVFKNWSGDAVDVNVQREGGPMLELNRYLTPSRETSYEMYFADWQDVESTIVTRTESTLRISYDPDTHVLTVV